jgi:hypothetical protein
MELSKDKSNSTYSPVNKLLDESTELDFTYDLDESTTTNSPATYYPDSVIKDDRVWTILPETLNKIKVNSVVYLPLTDRISSEQGPIEDQLNQIVMFDVNKIDVDSSDNLEISFKNLLDSVELEDKVRLYWCCAFFGKKNKKLNKKLQQNFYTHWMHQHKRTYKNSTIIFVEKNGDEMKMKV